jgi:AraC family transcriptional regulator
MEQMAAARPEDGSIEFSILRTSRNRFWTGFNAILYEATAGVDETLFARHSISMHVGAPVAVTTRCDGLVQHKIQVPGDIKIIPAGFSRIWAIERTARKLSINIDQSLIEAAIEAMGLSVNRVSITPQLQVRDPQIEHVAWAIKGELEADAPIGRLYADSLGLALAALLVRRYAPSVPRDTPKGLSARRLRGVIDYIRDHLAQDLTIVELAHVADVSPSHFNMLFKQSVGLSVHQYIIRLRVEHAIGLLSHERLPLSEVAFQAGFANQSHMTTWIRRLAGVTPRALRNSAL